MGEAAPALGFVFIFMYLFSKLWTKRDSGVTFIGAQIGHRHHLPSLLDFSSLLNPASLSWGLETLGTDNQKLFSL